MARLTLSLADALGVSSHAELVALEHGALLYDIGKLDVPSAILMKSAPLDNREWEVMRCIHSSAMIFEEAAHFLWTGRPRPRASWGVRWDRVSKGVEGGGRVRWERGCWQLPTRMTR